MLLSGGYKTRGYRLPKEGEWILRDGWYWPDKPCRNKQHVAPRNQFRQCVQCIREQRKGKRHYQDAASYKRWTAANRQHMSAWRRDYNLRNPARRMLASARATAKKLGLPFNLTLEDIVIPEHCPALGIVMRTQSGPRHATSPSLDRIIPSLGYTRGNIVVVSWKANRIKCDASIDELRRVAGFYSQLTRKKRRQRPPDANTQLELPSA